MRPKIKAVALSVLTALGTALAQPTTPRLDNNNPSSLAESPVNEISGEGRNFLRSAGQFGSAHKYGALDPVAELARTGYLSTRPQSSYAAPVVIQFSGRDHRKMHALTEEIAIMERVIDRALENALGPDVPPKTLGVPMRLTAGGRSVNALYLETFGVIFSIQVNFPVVQIYRAPTSDSEARPSSDWEEARRDLLQSSTARGVSDAGRPLIYDPQLVKTLTDTLLLTLRNASNIRQLSAEESISVSVFGPAEVPEHAIQFTQSTSAEPIKVLPAASGQGSVLTFLVKKTDIDSYAKGQLDAAGFRAKVTSLAYEGRGHVLAGSNNSFLNRRATR